MAGQLTISTLSDGTNSTSATNCIQGSAKAWVNFNGVSGSTIRSSYNVSSITRNTTGDYTVNFTNALSDANYSTVFGVSPVFGTASMIANAFCTSSSTEVAPTSSAFRFVTLYSSGAAYAEPKYICVSVFR